MNREFETYADIDGERGAVVVSFDVDGYKPLIYGVFNAETDDDLTPQISESEFDRIYIDVSRHIIEGITEAAGEYQKEQIETAACEQQESDWRTS